MRFLDRCQRMYPSISTYSLLWLAVPQRVLPKEGTFRFEPPQGEAKAENISLDRHTTLSGCIDTFGLQVCFNMQILDDGPGDSTGLNPKRCCVPS
jgi:hypothetical protein